MSTSLPSSIGTGANDNAVATTHAQPQEEEKKKLSFLDKYLSGWILLAAAIGLGLGQAHAVMKAIKASSVGTTNIPIAIGLILMIFPPLAKVRWNKMRGVFSDTYLVALTLVLNWVVGPFLMYFLVRETRKRRWR
jgi:ACR3 family arsenite transporter